jgi:hypothetical protein
MATISRGLKEKAEHNPDKTFRVLIVADESWTPDTKRIKIREKWMGNILLADAKGAEITQLLLDPAVHSVEEDGRVQTSG